MNVVHTIASTRLDHGGTSRSVPQTCDALAECGHEVHFITGVPADTSIRCNFPRRAASVNLVPESAYFGRLAVGRSFIDELRRLTAAADIRLVHDHGLWLPSNRAVAQFSRRQRVPLVISPRGMMTAWAMQYHSWKKRLAWFLFQHRVLQSASGFHATSQEEADEVRERGFHQPIAVIPNGVTTPLTMPIRQSTTRRVLFLSRIHPKKGLIQLVQAWHQVVRGQSDSKEISTSASFDVNTWRLVIAGPDENGHQQEIVAEVRRLGLEDSVEFPGAVADDDKWQLLVDSDIFILPSFSENFGIVVAEAMVAGLPVIASTGTPWRLLADHDCGWWVEPTVASLAEALYRSMQLDDGARRAMGRRGQEYARSEFSWGRVAKELAQFYDSLLSK